MSQPIQSFIRTRRLAALVTIGLLASGCQVIAPSQWEDRAVLPALPVTYLEVPRTEMVAICADHSGQRLLGCAKRDYAKRTCTIVTGSNPDLALLDHERKHCAGYDHNAAPVRVATLDVTAGETGS
ncbi:MAG: hypothetical protein ABIQ72_01325 [Usitatibacter sp.]